MQTLIECVACSGALKMNCTLHFGQLISLVRTLKITVKMVFVTNSVLSGEATLWCPVWINHTIFGEKREVIIAVITRNIYLNLTQGCFIYILNSSNPSSVTFWCSQFNFSSRSNCTDIWTGNSKAFKHSSHFSTSKEMSVKATFFFT